jgi:hypothetical protein
MSTQIEIWYNPANDSHRWLGYFDLLGTRTLIKSHDHFYVFTVYATAIEEAKKTLACQPAVSSVWFSDTFLIYTSDDSAQNFAFIDQVSRWFVYFLLTTASIPVRGAISCGDFYADRSRNLYFGPALVEAYEYGEAQDWIGFLLGPSAVTRLNSLGIPAGEHLNYAYWNIPFKNRKGKLISKLPACILGQWIEINGKNPCLEKLYKLKRCVKLKDVGKYEKAIKFIEKCQRKLVIPSR